MKNLKTKHIIYPLTILIMIIVPVIRYYVSTPGINACVLDYVDNIEDSEYIGYIYSIDWVRHIEPANSKNNSSLEQYKIWESEGCIMRSNNLFSDLNNTFYCAVTYMIRKSPLNNSIKKPLEIMKSE